HFEYPQTVGEGSGSPIAGRRDGVHGDGRIRRPGARSCRIEEERTGLRPALRAELPAPGLEPRPEHTVVEKTLRFALPAGMRDVRNELGRVLVVPRLESNFFFPSGKTPHHDPPAISTRV